MPGSRQRGCGEGGLSSDLPGPGREVPGADLAARKVHDGVVERHLLLVLDGVQLSAFGESGRALEEGFIKPILGGGATPASKNESKTNGSPSDPSAEVPLMMWKCMCVAEVVPGLPSRPGWSPTRTLYPTLTLMLPFCM